MDERYLRYLFGIGMVLAMLLAFTASAAADNVVYFDPDPSCIAPGEEITVTLWLDADDGSAAFNDRIYFNPDVVNITAGTPGDFPTLWGFVHGGDNVSIGGWSSTYLDLTGHLKLADLTFVGNSFGTSTLHHDDCAVGNESGYPRTVTWTDGTFNCPCPTPENFTKELALGWNLISLPLTPTDNSVSVVLSGVSQNAVKQYNATSKLFEDAATMDPGIGYFVNVTTAGIWEYEGTAYTSISATLSTGLNCVGWTNETGSALPGALSSIDGSYRYVVRWNAGTQSYEVYLPDAPAVFSDFTTMDRGEGYFIAATSSCTLAYP